MSFTPAVETSRILYEAWKESHQYGFELVQRVEPGTDWFGRKFDLDCMGNAIFEFGAANDALNRIRASMSIAVHVEEITVGKTTRSVYFVGDVDTMAAKLVVFKKCLANGLPAKEHTGFAEALDGQASTWDRTVAWWSFDADVLWTLDKDVANQLQFGVLHPAKK